jgi:hypothetical protein
MANYNLTDLVSTVSISKNEYEELVRNSLRLEIVKGYVEKSNYVSTNDIKFLLGIEEKEEGEE